ncbi:hypothetical protein [Pedobacter aquatilis]|nr:hypothetical protein [Pedobacter aquatilis]
MLRHEASATYETDSSYLSMTDANDGIEYFQMLRTVHFQKK